MSSNYLLEKVALLQPQGGCRVHVQFADGFTGTVDLTGLLDAGPIFEPLRDPAFFAGVRLERGVPVWSDALDLSPGTLRAWCEAGRLLSDEETDAWIATHSHASQEVA